MYMLYMFTYLSMYVQVMEVRKYFALSTHDGFIWLITFLSTVLLDVDYGNIIQEWKLLNKFLYS